MGFGLLDLRRNRPRTGHRGARPQRTGHVPARPSGGRGRGSGLGFGGRWLGRGRGLRTGPGPQDARHVLPPGAHRRRRWAAPRTSGCRHAPRSPGSPARQGGAGCLQGLGHETLQRLDVAKPGKPRSAGQRLEGRQVAQLPGARRSLRKLQHLIENLVLGLDLQGVLEDQPAKLAHDPPPHRFL